MPLEAGLLTDDPTGVGVCRDCIPPPHLKVLVSQLGHPKRRPGGIQVSPRIPRDQTLDIATDSVSAGHRLVENLYSPCPKPAKTHTCPGYVERASDLRFRRSEALYATLWQVKDSNLRSFRDGFTGHHS